MDELGFQRTRIPAWAARYFLGFCGKFGLRNLVASDETRGLAPIPVNPRHGRPLASPLS